MDRLLLELKLPPADAYFKLVHTLEEVWHVEEYSEKNPREDYSMSDVLYSVLPCEVYNH